MKDNYSFRAGTKALLNPKKGWYSIRPVEGDTELVKGSVRSVETYFQYQHQHTSGWLAGKKKHFIVSAEVRDRVKFGDPFFLSIPKPLKVLNLLKKRGCHLMVI